MIRMTDFSVAEMIFDFVGGVIRSSVANERPLRVL